MGNSRGSETKVDPIEQSRRKRGTIATICNSVFRIFDKYLSSPIDLHKNRNILYFSLEKMKPYDPKLSVDKDPAAISILH